MYRPEEGQRSSSPASASRSDILLAWYDAERRHLPWRYAPGAEADPYRVWLSEVMLQQTTVAAVIPYFNAFTARWPTVVDLAAADDEAVMAAWAGLGYYARARNLLKCARAVRDQFNGRFPDTEEALRRLPGIGVYTAAAIAAIAYGQRAVVVDGNVERVISRLFAITDPLPGSRDQIRTLADSLTPALRSGDYAQAMMDLGATLCSPRNPACGLCPWMRDCEGRKLGLAETLPAKAAKAEKPVRKGMAFWVVRWDGSVLLRKRPPQGLLGGMMEIPSTPWREETWTETEAKRYAPLTADWRMVRGLVRHTFTHFHLELTVLSGVAKGGEYPGCRWVQPENFDGEALPTVMRKIVRLALGGGGR